MYRHTRKYRRAARLGCNGARWSTRSSTAVTTGFVRGHRAPVTTNNRRLHRDSQFPPQMHTLNMHTPNLPPTRPVLGKRSSLGRAAALLASCPPPTTPGHTWACLWCRPSPEFPPCLSFAVWVLGWSTRYLCANNPTSCASSTKLYRCSSTYFPTSAAGPALPALATPAPAAHSTAASLTRRTWYLLALHCCFCNHWGCVKLKLAVVTLPVVVYATAAGLLLVVYCVEAGVVRC
jgi:hypothetical protein